MTTPLTPEQRAELLAQNVVECPTCLGDGKILGVMICAECQGAKVIPRCQSCSALLATLTAQEDEIARLKALARPEHDLIVSIVKRLRDIGHLAATPDANITGAIHGVIDGYESYRRDYKAAVKLAEQAEAALIKAEAEKSELVELIRNVAASLMDKWRAANNPPPAPDVKEG